MQISANDPKIIAESRAARVSVLPARGRLSLRTRPRDQAALGRALGLDLPARIGQRTTAGEVEALALGPDEWAIHLPLDAVFGLLSAGAAVMAAHPHSLVDISGREVSLLIEGPRAAELLTLGCPRDIDSIAVGEGRRTLFDGATVILWREAQDRFRMDIWHSFAPHLARLLITGTGELAAEQE